MRSRQPKKKPFTWWSHVEYVDGPCPWLWTNGSTDDHGYGVVHDPVRKRNIRASRMVYETIFGPVPDELWMLHHCDNPQCVYPLHIYPGTPEQNKDDLVRRQRSHQLKKTHCPKGHHYSEENTYTYKGKRHCRECHNERNQQYRQKVKQHAGCQGDGDRTSDHSQC